MSVKQEFVKTSEGVHLVHRFSDYTLCGDALEGDPDNELEENEATNERSVSCPKCAAIINHCKDI